MPIPHLHPGPQPSPRQPQSPSRPTWRTLPAEVQQSTTALLVYLLQHVQNASSPDPTVREVTNDDE